MIDTPFGNATEISTEIFLQQVLPPLRKNIKIDELLKEKDDLGRPKLPVVKNQRLWGYSTKGPSRLKGPKLATFNSLSKCASQVARAVPSGLSVTLDFKNNDRSQWALEKRAINALPDAYFLLRSAGQGLVDWTAIAIPGVYSKTYTKKLEKDNIVKITRCLAHSMHCDARRRFAYGFSIEDSKTRLWYCDRSQIIVSEAFDFVVDWRTLFHFFFSTMLAEDHELGLDPSVGLIRDDVHGLRYEITVPSAAEQTVYRTVSLVSDTTPEAIVGRGTRVWKAIRVENGMEIGEPVALKDSWVDNDGEREGATYRNILASTTGSEATDILKKYLLTVLLDGDVFVNGVLDCARIILPQSADNFSHTDTDIGHPRSIRPPRRQVHYRVIYEEVCEANLHYVASLHTVFKALGDTCIGLGALHECGWVHRDISPANILLYRDSVKIADLEYAFRYEDLQHEKHHVVGTEKYIAIEVQLGQYLFAPTKEPKISAIPPNFDVNKFVRENAARKERGEPQIPFPKSPSPIDTEPPSKLKFSYNPLHDLESLWWIGLSFLIYREVDGKSTKDTFACSEALETLVTNLFRNCSRDSRTVAIGEYGYLKGHLWDFHPTVQDAAELLMEACTTLVSDYRALEQIPSTSFRDVKHETYAAFLRCLYTIAKTFQTHDVAVRIVR